MELEPLNTRKLFNRRELFITESRVGKCRKMGGSEPEADDREQGAAVEESGKSGKGQALTGDVQICENL